MNMDNLLPPYSAHRHRLDKLIIAFSNNCIGTFTGNDMAFSAEYNSKFTTPEDDLDTKH